MQSLFIVSLPRSMSSFIFQVAQLSLGFQQPIWTSDGEVLNNDRFATYEGEGYDESVKFTHPDRNPDTFARLTAFLNEATVAQNFVYKDVIQPFVLANWLPTSGFKVLKIKRPFIDIHDAGPDGLFSDEETDQLLTLVREVNESLTV